MLENIFMLGNVLKIVTNKKFVTICEHVFRRQKGVQGMLDPFFFLLYIRVHKINKHQSQSNEQNILFHFRVDASDS